MTHLIGAGEPSWVRLGWQRAGWWMEQPGSCIGWAVGGGAVDRVSSWSSFGSSVPRRQSAGAEHSAVQVTHWWLQAKERQSDGKKQYSLSILQIPPLHMIWITSHVTVDVLTQALNLIAMAPLAMRSFFSVAVYQLACCLIPPSHILYHPPYVDLPQICKREIWMLPNVSHSHTCPPIWNVDGKPQDSWYYKIVMHIDFFRFHSQVTHFCTPTHLVWCVSLAPNSNCKIYI